MKKRIGFVSNSSSSSFIIATKGDQSTRALVEIDLDELISSSISTKEELVEYILEDYCFGIEDWDKYLTEDGEYFDEYIYENYTKMLKSIEAGYTIHTGNASSEGESGLETMICNEGIGSLKFIDDVKIIEGDGGY